ncbi:hypothetical protein Harman_39400 [Haloarcula mannanilytica]|uniref:Uncharacterized protein n=2 Tax=Haloarcula mannanilytica TaxID=2509225 RepID=A0A4C2ENY0_9EURY|nr:hypothetical protein Harman_39400 [Haloarcula mannanilytica]
MTLSRTRVLNRLPSAIPVPPQRLFDDTWYTNYMSEESAQIYNRARQNGGSSAEAWEDLQSLSEDIDWDVERMLSESSTVTDADRELPQ